METDVDRNAYKMWYLTTALRRGSLVYIQRPACTPTQTARL